MTWQAQSLAVGALIALLYLCNRFVAKESLRSKMLSTIILASLTIPFMNFALKESWGLVDWLAISPAISLFGFLYWEAKSPRRQHSFAGSHGLKTAAYNILRPLSGVVFTATLMPVLKPFLPVVWSLTNNEVPLFIQAISFLIVADFKEWAWHWAGHRFDVLWKVHKVHHSPEEMSVLGWAPSNLFEFVFVRAFSTAALAVIFDVNAIAATFYTAVAFLVSGYFAHANVDFPKAGTIPLWSKFFSSPTNHGHHHTVEGMRTNYGMIFSFWDVWFGTFEMPRTAPIEFGIADSRYSAQNIFMDQIAAFLPEPPPAESQAAQESPRKSA